MTAKYSDENALIELECSVCSDPITDPRPLICGHSFCGPPRRCLFLLEQSPNVLTCAICRNDHKAKPTDIKPLYGIRDFFDSQERSGKEHTERKSCDVHQKQYTLWCATCEVMICEDCFEDTHDGHLVRKIKKYLEEEVQNFLKMDLIRGLNKFQTHLEETQKTVLTVLESRKHEITKLQLLTKNASQLRDKINLYLISKNDPIQSNSSVCETDLLIDIHHLLKPELTGKLFQSSSWQTLSALREDKFAQTISVKQATAETRTNTGVVDDHIRIIETDLFPGVDLVEQVFPWCTWVLSMEVENKNPLKIHNSATLDVIQKCKIWLSAHAANCPEHIHYKSCSEKLLRVTIHCDYKNREDDYKILLTKLELSLEIIMINIKKSATLLFPLKKDVEVDFLSYDQSVQPNNKWIRPDQTMKLIFRYQATSMILKVK